MKRQSPIVPNPGGRRAAWEQEGAAAAAGAVSGALIGTFGGPVGAAIGAVAGAAAGAVAGAAFHARDKRASARDRELDRAIGIDGGEIGAPNLEHPPARVGTYSSASAGSGGATDSAPAEGPMQPPDE